VRLAALDLVSKSTLILASSKMISSLILSNLNVVCSFLSMDAFMMGTVACL
jgi:hypothetical protein